MALSQIVSLNHFGSSLENVPYSSVLSKSHNMFLKVIYSRSHYPITSSTTFNYIILSHYILISALVLVTQEIPIIVDSYLLVNYSTFTPRSPRPIVTQLDNNTFPTQESSTAVYVFMENLFAQDFRGLLQLMAIASNMLAEIVRSSFSGRQAICVNCAAEHLCRVPLESE